MTQYRIDWTRFVPGGHHTRESDVVRGDLGSVRSYLDHSPVHGHYPIVVTEYTESDGEGRMVPTTEWDICED